MLVGIGGGIAAVAFFTGNDDATQSEDAVRASVPGKPSSDARALSDLVQRGNVVVYLPRGYRSAAARLDEIYGPETKLLVRTGQALVKRYRKDDRPALHAYAFKRELTVSDVDDPRLQQFIDHWIGRSGS